MKEIKPCLHCSVEVVCLTRGLCCKCWRNREIRAKYPMMHNRRKQSEATPEDITMEALEAMIAEQLPTMPGHDERTGGPRLKTLPRAVSFGRGIDAAKFRNKPRRSNWA